MKNGPDKSSAGYYGCRHRDIRDYSTTLQNMAACETHHHMLLDGNSKRHDLPVRTPETYVTVGRDLHHRCGLTHQNRVLAPTQKCEWQGRGYDHS